MYMDICSEREVGRTGQRITSSDSPSKITGPSTPPIMFHVKKQDGPAGRGTCHYSDPQDTPTKLSLSSLRCAMAAPVATHIYINICTQNRLKKKKSK